VKTISLISREVCEPSKELSALLHHNTFKDHLACVSDMTENGSKTHGIILRCLRTLDISFGKPTQRDRVGSSSHIF
jgi:hypothetical protein